MITLIIIGYTPNLTYSSSQTLIYVNPSSTLVKVGENFTINVDVQNAPEFNVFGFKLSYNTSVLDVLKVEQKLPWTCVYEVSEADGNIDAYGMGSNIGGNQTLASITFNATSIGRSALDLYQTYLVLNTIEIQHSSIDGYAYVGTLSINLMTDKNSYYLEHIVQINGTLHADGLQICDGLIAIELQNSNSEHMIFRTLTTGGISPIYRKITILTVFPCDKYGNPKNTFSAGTPLYFNATLKNLSQEDLPVRLAAIVYSADGRPIGYATMKTSCFASGTTMSWRPIIDLPSTAANGIATIYVNAYSDYPSEGGTPYCPEKNATFLLSSSVAGSGSVPPSLSENGTYFTAFRLPLGKGLGPFKVYVSSEYSTQKAYNLKTFNATLQGDIDGDGFVYVNDLDAFGRAWYTRLGEDPNYNPKADFDGDGIIYVDDLDIFGRNWYKKAWE
jgi:hypothetical protein